jgi:hypothetical protein
VTLDVASEKLRKTPTSIASKLVRLGIFKDRAAVNAENRKRGGNSVAAFKRSVHALRVYNLRAPIDSIFIFLGKIAICFVVDHYAIEHDVVRPALLVSIIHEEGKSSTDRRFEV